MFSKDDTVTVEVSLDKDDLKEAIREVVREERRKDQRIAERARIDRTLR